MIAWIHTNNERPVLHEKILRMIPEYWVWPYTVGSRLWTSPRIFLENWWQITWSLNLNKYQKMLRFVNNIATAGHSNIARHNLIHSNNYNAFHLQWVAQVWKPYSGLKSELWISTGAGWGSHNYFSGSESLIMLKFGVLHCCANLRRAFYC